MAYLTLEQAKLHLRVDHDEEDQDIILKLEASTAIINNHVTDVVTDDTGEAFPDVKAACAILLGVLYRDRDETKFEGVGFNYLPFTVTALLSPYRLPVAR